MIVARCLQTQSILKRLTIEQWSTIEKSPFSVTSPSFIQYESRLSGFHACMNVSCDLCFSQSQLRIAYFHANGKYYYADESIYLSLSPAYTDRFSVYDKKSDRKLVHVR